jgi:hypothetical protein
MAYSLLDLFALLSDFNISNRVLSPTMQGVLEFPSINITFNRRRRILNHDSFYEFLQDYGRDDYEHSYFHYE